MGRARFEELRFYQYIRKQKQGAETFGEKHILEPHSAYDILAARELTQFPNSQIPDPQSLISQIEGEA